MLTPTLLETINICNKRLLITRFLNINNIYYKLETNSAQTERILLCCAKSVKKKLQILLSLFLLNLSFFS